MKAIVFKYGLISGAILIVMMVFNFILFSGGHVDLSTGEIIGYSSMVVAFLIVFFGIRSYRDQVRDGSIGFGKAFQVGILITLISCAGYIVAWEILYFNFASDFVERYTESLLDEMREEGASEDEIAETETEMAEFRELYQNPLINVAFTFLEVFPIGLVMTLVSAGILRKKEHGDDQPAPAT